MVGACPHAACPGAAVPARVPAQHLLSLHSEAAFRRAVLHCGCASWLQNPFLEPYGKTELCQTVWPVLFVFLFFFFFPFALAASWRRIPRQQSYKHASGEGCVELGLPGFPALFVRAFYVWLHLFPASINLQPGLQGLGCWLASVTWAGLHLSFSL